MTRKKVIILGATGSVGMSTLNVIRQHPSKFEILGIAFAYNVEAAAEIIREFEVPNVAVADETAYGKIKEIFKDSNISFYKGMDGIIELASIGSDVAVMAISGTDGILPAIQATKSTKILAIANKESIICAGNIIRKIALEYDTKVIPVDSEHSGIYQVVKNHNMEDVRDICITASGGPFLKADINSLDSVTPSQAIKHPRWKMGRKISVDSATMANKGLELIEAYYLFDIKPERIHAIIHPESIIHAIVNFKDGSSILQMSEPSMMLPIAYALSGGERIESSINPMDLKLQKQLNFDEIDYNRFPAFKLAIDVMKLEDQSLNIAYNTINEFAVYEFLNGKISFTSIARIIEEALSEIKSEKISELEDVLDYKNYILEHCLQRYSK